MHETDDFNTLATAKGISRPAYNLFIPWPSTFKKKIKDITVLYGPSNIVITKKSKELFDVGGNLLEEAGIRKGKIVLHNKHIYEAGVLVKTINVLENKEIEVLQPAAIEQNEVVEIDENGRQVVSLFNVAGTLKRRTVYNEKDQVLEIIYQGINKPLQRYIYTYNNAFQLVRAEYITRNGNKKDDTVFKYNQEGFLTEEVGFPVDLNDAFADNPGASTGYSSRYFYDIDGLLIAQNRYDKGWLITTRRYYYTFWQIE